MRARHLTALGVCWFLCVLQPGSLPIRAGEDTSQLKMRISELQAEAEEHAATIAEYEKQIAQYEDRVTKLTQELSRLKALCVKNGISTKAADNAIQPPIILKSAVNEIGWIGKVKVVQIQDKASALVETRVLHLQNGRPVRRPARISVSTLKLNPSYLDSFTEGCVRVEQAGETSLVYGSFSTASKSFLLKGVDTSTCADGTALEVNAYCRITGTESRLTATGAKRTLFVLEPLHEDVDY